MFELALVVGLVVVALRLGNESVLAERPLPKPENLTRFSGPTSGVVPTQVQWNSTKPSLTTRLP